MLALQARDNAFEHSEVDFGSLVWSAWGARLLTDFGYGTIATAVGEVCLSGLEPEPLHARLPC